MGFDDFGQWFWDFGQWVDEVGLMMVVVWVDDGGWVDDCCCSDR